ncbi:MAG: hypothetical protein CTY12_00400 [Methylotenera sp.]|nr:MAG: hypothetical protein CTY12_00400 [Methylotenera sp.]
MLTFKKFLTIIEEDAAIDKQVVDIQAAIGQIDAQINQHTQQLLSQKQQLTRRLAPLLKRKQDDDTKAARDANQPQNQQQVDPNQQMQSGITTPGSAGAATPGQPR